MAGAIAVVKQVFTIGVVNRQHRKSKFTSCLAGLVAQYSGGGLFAGTPDFFDVLALGTVQVVYQVAPIINYNVRSDVQRRQLMLLELLFGGIVPGVHVQS